MIQRTNDTCFIQETYTESKKSDGCISHFFCQFRQQVQDAYSGIRRFKSTLVRAFSILGIPKRMLKTANILSVSDLFLSAKKVYEQFFETLSLRLDQGTFVVLCLDEASKAAATCKNVVRGFSSIGYRFPTLVTELTWLVQVFGLVKIFRLFDTLILFEKEYALYVVLKKFVYDKKYFILWLQENEASLYETAQLSKTLYLKERCSFETQEALHDMLLTHITRKCTYRVLQLLLNTLEVSLAIFACITYPPKVLGLHKTICVLDTVSTGCVEFFVGDNPEAWHRRPQVVAIVFFCQKAFQFAKDLDDTVKRIKMPCIKWHLLSGYS